jgi:hypothetical protein
MRWAKHVVCMGGRNFKRNFDVKTCDKKKHLKELEVKGRKIRKYFLRKEVGVNGVPDLSGSG